MTEFKTPTWFEKHVKSGTSSKIKRFDNELDAAKFYNAKAKELFGDFAKLNEL